MRHTAAPTASRCRRVAVRVAEHAARTGSDAAAALSMFVNVGRHRRDGRSLRASLGRSNRSPRWQRAPPTPYAVVTLRFMLAAYDLLLGNIDAAAQHAAVAIEASGTSSPDEPPEHVPLVLLPVIAGVAAAVQGDAVRAREHSQRRAPRGSPSAARSILRRASPSPSTV